MKKFKSINLKKEDLPENYESHITHRKIVDNSWHFDPKAQDKSSIILPRIEINNKLKKFLVDFCNTIPSEIGTSIREGELENYKENNLIWNKLDHVYHGYNANNTEISYIRLNYSDANELLKNVVDQTNLEQAGVGVIRLCPGQVIPWHYDNHVFFNASNKDKSSSYVERHMIFPFDWDWGHIFQIGNNVLSNWEMGASYTWPKYRYHLAANAGINDFYMLAITGIKNS